MKNLGKIVLFLLLTQCIVLAKAGVDSDFILTLQSTKKEVYVGEPLEVILLFKQKKDVEAVDSEFIAPTFNGFWIKNKSTPQKVQDKDYAITKITYTIAAQRAGGLKVHKAQIRVASRINTRDSLGKLVSKKWKIYFSNELNIKAITLPNGVDLVGNFSITTSVDKSEVNAKEAINLTVEVISNANLEDISSFKPSIEGVNIFEEEIVIDENKLSQKIVFVGENDFLIPPFVLKYFNPITKKIKTASTRKIHIKVKNAKSNQELIIKKEEVEKETFLSDFWIIMVYILGLISGILLTLYKPWSFSRKEKLVSIKKPKALLWKLIAYKNDDKVDNIINILEKNIYSDSIEEVDKKILKEIIKKYEIY